MATFRDADGREWSVELDTVTADEIKATHKIDLIDPEQVSTTLIQLASGSTRTIVEMLWMLIEPQAKKLGVEPETFGRAMKSQAVRAGYHAIKDAVADFFPNPDVGAALRRTWAAAERVVSARLGEFSEAKIEKLLTERASGVSAGSTRESPASTLAGVE